MPKTLILTLVVSIAVHSAVVLYQDQESRQSKTSMGSIQAPISMTFSTVYTPKQPEPKPEPEEASEEPHVKEKPVIKDKPKPKDAVKIARREPVKQPKKKPVEREIEKPKPREEPVAEPETPPQQKSVVKKSETEGLSNEPVFVSQPAIRSCVQPDYPRMALRRNQEGVVMLEVIVSKTGKPSKVTVLTTSGFNLLDQSAIEAVKHWEFEPQKRNNELVVSRVHLPVAFQLN